jgi:methionyl-tRNA formyltransferase
MKFVLLASGKIAEKFVTDRRFVDLISNHLEGVIASDEILDLIERKFENCKKISSKTISDKSQNENDLYAIISECAPDFILSIQYPWIIPGAILNIVTGKVLNLHNAKIPEYRGHNSISHEILNNEKAHTTTLHWVAEEVDRGRIVKTREIPIENHDTAFSLWNKSVDSALVLLDEVFSQFANDQEFPAGLPVGQGGKFYSKNIAPFKKVPSINHPEIIEKWARAFYFPPHEPAYIESDGRKIYLLLDNWNY